MKQFRIEIPENDTLQIFSITEQGDKFIRLANASA